MFFLLQLPLLSQFFQSFILKSDLFLTCSFLLLCFLNRLLLYSFIMFGLLLRIQSSSLLIAEEVAVANMLAENRAESVLGPVGPHIGPEPVMLSLWS